MSKKVEFSLTIEFADKITSDSDLMEIANRVANLIAEGSRDYGVAPDDSDTYTVSVKVSPVYLDDSVTIEV